VALPASKKTRALLGYLVVTGVPQLREHLCGLLWQGPDDPRGALRWSLTKLRAALGDEHIEATRERAGFAAEGVTVDTAFVKQALAAGVGAAPAAVLEQVAASFRGELLEGLDLPDSFRWHEWCVAQREAMRTAHVAVLAELVGRLASEPERALVHARRRLAVDPIAEDAHVAVVRLLTALGRNREASDQVDACKRVLQQELEDGTLGGAAGGPRPPVGLAGNAAAPRAEEAPGGAVGRQGLRGPADDDRRLGLDPRAPLLRSDRRASHPRRRLG
jgi:DNA-binding SARP family transcriptional activator